MDLHVALAGPGDRVSRIYRALLDRIRDGHLSPGDRLPPTRTFAADLGVARSTVASAYERLTAEGYLEGRVGAGTFVTDAAVPVGPRRRGRSPGGVRPRPGWTFVPRATSGGAPVPAYDFRVGVPDPALFPFDTWRRLLAAETRLRANSPGTYADPAGHPGLRAAVARHVGLARSVVTPPDDIVITNGTQQGLDLVTRVLVSPGDVVAIEEPGYPPARDTFASLGASVVGVRVDDEGVVVDELPARARLVHVTPSHQFPLGPAMSLARRHALLDWARAHGAAIVEDDYDAEFRWVDRPLDALHSLDTHQRVIYLGTFSKTLLPSLRIGYVVSPPGITDALRAARQLADFHGAIATQAALARFMDEGRLARHVRSVSGAYAERRRLVIDFLEHELADAVHVVGSVAGLHVTARLPWAGSGTVVSLDRLTARAARAGLAVETLAGYTWSVPPEAGLVLGFGALQPGMAPAGLQRIADIVHQLRAQAGPDQ